MKILYAGKITVWPGKYLYIRAKLLNKGERLKNPKADAKPELEKLVEIIDNNLTEKTA